MVKLKDFINERINKKNNQVSLDIKKRKLKKFELNIDDILELEINKKEKKFKW